MMLDMLMMRIELRTGLAISIYHGRADGEGLMQAVADLPVCNPWAWHVYIRNMLIRAASAAKQWRMKCCFLASL